MALHRRLVRVALMGLVVAGTFGCELMTAVDRDKIPEETPGAGGGSAGSAGATDGGKGGTANGGSAGQGGQAGGAGTAGSGGEAGKGGAGGTAGAGGSAGECTVPADCDPPANECIEATCNGGKCGTSNKAAGTAVAVQVAGDCKKAQCNGQGAIESVNDDADLPVDANPCTKDVCTNGAPSNPAETLDTACGTGLKCNATGQCIGCTTATECPGTDGECSKRSCSAEKVCSLALVPAGTPTESQVAGDCLEKQCDNKGEIVTVPAQNDAVDDGDDCTQDVCFNGQSTHPNKSAGAECNDDGGSVCDGKGACVACTLPSHCTGDPIAFCQERTCSADNKCGVGNKASGTSLPKGTLNPAGDCKDVQCDGNGATTTVNLNTDVPNDNNDCTTDTCVDGTVTYTDTAVNTACGAAGSGLKCDGDGKCVGCTSDTDCVDTSACTTGEKCTDGTCVPGTDVVCNDNNPCTTDGCDPASGCTVTKLTGTACNDGSACTNNDVCADGTCGGTTIVCNDNNPCTTDGCDPASGCTKTNDDTATCEDGDACTTGDKCELGECKPGTGTLACGDSNPCTDHTCDPTDGCVETFNTAACNDDNQCTTNDTCAAGKCEGAAITCNDTNPCTDDSCDPATGCTTTNNSASCTDAYECTTGDKCESGLCSGTPNTGATCGGGSGVCNASGLCGCIDDGDCNDPNANDCQVFTCVSGACTPGSAAENANCSTDPCLTGQTCASGACTGGTPKCSGNACNDATCDNGTCGLTPKSDATSCDADGDPCTEADHCVSGQCTAGAPKVCNPTDACHNSTCSSTTGDCVEVPGNDGAACTFGNQCNTGTTCLAGACQGGTLAVVCDDSRACTDDACDPATGDCVYTADINNTCSDGDECTQTDSCNLAGDCVPGTPVTCTASDQCHEVGTCDPATGVCSDPTRAGSCDDGQFCTTGETCSSGVCGGSSNTQCTTENQCLQTPGTCNEATDQCDFTPVAPGSPCTSFTHKDPECFDANTARTYTNTATCQFGTVCSEGYTDTVCPLGCSGGACRTDLMITEYVEGTSNNKAIEITNFGTAGIDLAQCTIKLSNQPNPLTLSGTLAAGQSLVMCNNQSAKAILDVCTIEDAYFTFNGDDSIQLTCGTTLKDSFGQQGTDPGASWGTGLTITEDGSLRRKCPVVTGDTIANDAFDPATEWDGFGVDNFAGLGSPGCTPPNFTHTITIDGTKDFVNGERFAAGTGYYGYATWDTTHLYLAMEGAAVNSASATQWWLIYLSGTNGTMTGQLYNTQQPALPFSAGYHIRWKADNAYTNAQTWSGSAWVDAAWTFTGNVAKGTGTYVEMRIPLADIGSPSMVSVHMSMINEAAGTETTWAPFPSTSFTAGAVDPEYTKYYEFDLAAGKLSPTAYTPKP